MGELEEIRKRKIKELEQKILRKSAPSKTVEVTDKTFNQLIKNNPIIMIDFWAQWCAPCLGLAPIIEELAKKYAGKVVFGKLNVDNNKDTAKKFEIMAIPTLLFFKRGELVDRVVGGVSQEALEQRIRKLVG